MERREAVALGIAHYNTDRPCKHGHIAVRRVKDRKCSECERNAKGEKYKLSDPEAVRVKKQASYERTKKHHLVQKRIYRQANKGKINALVAARKKHIKQRTPKWFGLEERWVVKEVYELAASRTKMTGFAWHVDHIVPLQGGIVSGLHVMNNLQVIPGVDNIKKKNRYAE
jgi:hypothetical protein